MFLSHALHPSQLTYILVGYGTYPTVGSAIILALVRIAGIVAGGVVSLILAVVILPRSGGKRGPIINIYRGGNWEGR